MFPDLLASALAGATFVVNSTGDEPDDSPRGFVLDLVNDEIVVGNTNGPSVTTFPRAAFGNATPTRAIAGPSTFLAGVQSVAMTLSPPSGYFPIIPCRVADTRGAPGPCGGPSIPLSPTASS